MNELVGVKLVVKGGWGSSVAPSLQAPHGY